jgi:hypothetical protein
MRRRPPVRDSAPPDQERIVWRLVAEAQAQRALLAGDSDMRDVKALALLGLDGAVIAGLTASRPTLPSLWWVAIIALAVCVPFLLFTILSRPAYLGPNLSAFYEHNIDGGSLHAGTGLLSELDRDLGRTRQAMIPKALAYSVGLSLFIAGALFTAAFLARMAVVR